MSEKKIPVITINRQYAAYGRTIAAKVSERLGIPYYDKDFVKKTVAESGYDLDAITRDGEDITSKNRFVNAIMNIAVGSYPDYVKKIYEAEKEVILDLAKSPCIIVGRCANRISPSTLSSVIHTGTTSTRRLRERILMTVRAIRSVSIRARYLRMCARILLSDWSQSNVPGWVFRPGVNIEIEVGGISYLKLAVAQIWRQPFFAAQTHSSDGLR